MFTLVVYDRAKKLSRVEVIFLEVCSHQWFMIEPSDLKSTISFRVIISSAVFTLVVVYDTAKNLSEVNSYGQLCPLYLGHSKNTFIGLDY